MVDPPPASDRSKSTSLSNSTEVEMFLAFSTSGSTKTKSEFPILISSRELSVHYVTGTPLTHVLLRVTRSWILHCPALRRTSQCLRASPASSTHLWLEGSRPIEASSS